MPPSNTTKRALIVLGVLVCFAAATGAGLYFYYGGRGMGSEIGTGRAPGVLSELPSEAPLVAYLDVAALKKLQTSPIAAILGMAGATPTEDREYSKFVNDTGFDYTRDLNTVAIAFWPGDFGAASKGSTENRMLAIADGRFDQQKIKAYALRTGKVVMQGTGPIYDLPGDPAVSFRFLSPAQISIASGANAMDLVDVTGSHGNSSTLQSGIERVAGAPIFAVARTNNLPNSFYLNFHSSPQLERLARSVQNLTLAGQPDGDQILATLDAQCDSTQNAFELATLLDGARIIGAMALSDPKTRRQMTQEQFAFLNALIGDAKISHQDTWVRLKVAITPEMLGETSAPSSTSTPASPK